MPLTLSDPQHQILASALRVTDGGKPSRNRFISGPTCDDYAHVKELVAAGLLIQGKLCALRNVRRAEAATHYYHATPAGCAAVGAAFHVER